MIRRSENGLYLTTLLLGIFLSCCSDQHTPDPISPQLVTSGPTSPALPNKSVFGSFSVEEILDSIWSDTLRIRYDLDGGIDPFYYAHISRLAHIIDSTQNDTAGLFPARAFDKIQVRGANAFLADRGYAAYFGEPVELSSAQSATLLGLIRDPLSFSWGECGTWTPTARFEFKLNDQVVSVLDDGCWGQFRTDDPRMKFGGLTGRSLGTYRALLREFGIEAE